MKRFKFGSIVIVLTLLGPALPARSALADGTTAATELMHTGVELRKAGKDQEALVAFERANALDPTPATRAQIALARAALSDWVAAENDLREALAAPNDPWIARNHADLARTMTAIATHVTWLEVGVNVADATIAIDGHRLPEKRTRIAIGHIVLHTEAAGYLPDTRSIDVPPGDVIHVAIALAASPAAAPASAGPREVPLAEPHGPDRSAPLIVGAVGVVAIGVGTYYGIRAFSDRSESNNECAGTACTSKGLLADSDGHFAATAADIWIGVGVAILATSVTWLLLQPKHASPPRALSAGIGRKGPPLFEIHW